MTEHTDFEVNNEEDEVSSPPQTFQITFMDNKTITAFGYLAITPEMAVVGDSNGRFNFATNMALVHHINVIPDPVQLSVVKN